MEVALQGMIAPASEDGEASPADRGSREPMPARTVFAVMAGTNVDSDPMPAVLIERYRSAIDMALFCCDVTLFAHGSVDSSYTHDSGVRVTEVALVRAGELPTSEVPSLRTALARTASTFDQEAIGLLLHSAGTPSLVRPHEAGGDQASQGVTAV